MTVFFPIVFHFHQPVDNFDHVIEDIHRICYLPLLERIMRHPGVKITLHVTGTLLDWFQARHPEYLDSIRELCQRGQVELIGGGYHEPILPILPDDDKLGQVRKLSARIQHAFGVVPRGMWLAERVWEPQLPKFIAQAGLEYIIVDDNHLKSCGFIEADTFYHYTTEDAGHEIIVFPINEPVRYLAPWQPVWRLKEYLHSIATVEGDRLCLFISDAEKMGAWGTTHQLCYVQGHDGEAPYIDALFSFIEQSDMVKSITLSEYMGAHEPRGLIYLPNASYDKMEEWVLPTPTRRKMEVLKDKIKNNEIWNAKELDLERFVKGGFWRSFLVKYPESNNMHKKMLHVHAKLAECTLLLGDHPGVEKARESLYKSQANDCYWHGQFGGVYLNFLRHSVYRHALDAENAVELLLAGAGKPVVPKIEEISFLKNGHRQVVMETNYVNLYLDAVDGGTLFEWDVKPMSYNLMNTLARWPEAYHGDHDRDRLAFDHARKVALRDTITTAAVPARDLARNVHANLGGFATGEYKVSRVGREGDDLVATLERRAPVDGKEVIVTKTIKLNAGSESITVDYVVSGPELEFWTNHVFLVEFPVYLNGDPRGFRFIHEQGTVNPLDGFDSTCRSITLVDGSYDLAVSFSFSVPTRVITWSHETFSRMNTNDYQTKYQGIGMAFVPGELSFTITASAGKQR